MQTLILKYLFATFESGPPDRLLSPRHLSEPDAAEVEWAKLGRRKQSASREPRDGGTNSGIGSGENDLGRSLF